MTPVAYTTRKRIPRLPAQPFAFVVYLLRHCSRRMKQIACAGLFFAAAGAALDTLFTSWMLGRIVQVIAESKTSAEGLWRPLGHEMILLSVLWTARSGSFRLREWCERATAPELLNTARNLLFNRLIQQSQSFLHANFAGVLSNHVRRAGDVIGGLRDKLEMSIVQLLVRFLTGAALMWVITPWFSLFILVFVAIGIWAAIKTSPVWTSLSERQAEASSRLTGYIVDGVTNLSTVQQNTGWREEQRRMTRAQDDLTSTYLARARFYSWFWGIFDTLMTFFFCGFMALVAYGWQQGHVSTGQLAMTIALVTGLFGALASTVNLLSAKFDDIGILKEALHKIAAPISVTDKPDAPDLIVEEGMIEFRDVSFSYHGGAKVFSGLNLVVPAGQKIGLVGVSGAGKTTLCHLLLRAYDVTGGSILIDGQDIAAVTQDSLHESLAVIPQEPALFHRTLMDNIRYARLDATTDDVRRAAQDAAADHFIESLPQGYDTLVGERGVKLSGGQRQRVAIARAIVKNAPLLILDEATSALDSETERTIQSALIKAMEGRTTLVIAHRLSTLSHVDRIIVMEQGRIVEDGTFTELLAKEGVFARLWHLQAGGFLPEHLPEK